MGDSKAIDIISIDTLRLIPNIIALLSTISIILSIISNWIYFQILMPNALGLLTINDQISFAIGWIPKAIFFTALGGTIGKFVGQRPNSPFYSETYNRTIRGIKLSYIILPAFLFYLSFVYLFSDYFDFIYVLPPIYALFLYFFINNFVLREKISLKNANFLIFSSLLLLIAINSGNFLALRDLQKDVGNASIQLSDGKRFGDVVVLREIQRGIIVRDLKDKNIIFFPSDQIKRIYFNSNQSLNKRRICVYFGYYCKN